MLTSLLHGFTLLGEEWVLWALIGASVFSVFIMVERVLFFLGNRLPGAEELALALERGDREQALAAVAGKTGLEASVVRDALAAEERGREAVEEVLSATLVRERIRYERGLSVLGTLGNNAPFIGLFGTVLGIIRAFHDLANAPASAKAGGASAVMSGISGALVATAVGLAVAIPAVIAYNGFQRWLKQITASAVALGHAWKSHMKSSPSPHAGDRRVA